jgi:hypothetical protein
MKTLHLATIVGGVALVIGSVMFLIMPLQNQQHGYVIVQTDTISKNASSIHFCTQKQEQIFDPGPSGFNALMCPITPHTYVGKIDHSGFDDVCYDKKYDATNYFLNAGHNGSISYRIYLDVPFSNIFMFSHVDMTNRVSFSHYYAMVGNSVGWNYTETLDGVNVSFEPKSEMLWPWSSTLVTAKVMTSLDAKEGSHWVVLSPGACGGGPGFILTVDNASRIK